MSDVETALDELYASPLADFVQQRDAAADRVRETDRESAARIKSLRKPSVPAWAINQLARRHPDDLEQLFAIGEQLRAAHAALLAGDADPEEARRIAAEERAAIAALVERAAAMLAEAGITPTASYRERIADTLSATAGDEIVREAVARGRLTKESRRIGFGSADPSLQVLAGGKQDAGNAASRRDAERRQKREQLARKVRMLEADLEQAERAVREAEREHAETGRAVERARRSLDGVTRRLDDARADAAEHDT